MTGLITERGVLKADRAALSAAFPERIARRPNSQGDEDTSAADEPETSRGSPAARSVIPSAVGNTISVYVSDSPVAASSSAMACGALTTLIVVMPISRAGLRLTPRSSR